MALGQYAEHIARLQEAKRHFLNSPPSSASHFVTNSSSTSTSFDDGRSPSFSLELAASNSTVPLTINGRIREEISNENSRLTNEKHTSISANNRRRSTGAISKPWRTGWLNCFCKNREKPPQRFPACSVQINCLMAFGACISFILIISAYLMGRFLTYGSDCPANKFRNFDGTKDNLDYVLLRDRLFSLKNSKSPIGSTPIVRLNRDVIPIHYDVHWDLTDLRMKKIHGTVRILMDCLVAADSILLHASHQHISVSKISITSSIDHRSISVIAWNRTDQSLSGDGFSTVNLTLDSSLMHGIRYELSITYVTNICVEKSGANCYEDQQKLHNGHASIFVSTKFEPTAARTVIPCFDEPDLKATFNVTVVKHSDMVVITNSPSWKRVRTRHGQIIEHFEPTPQMSTYLLGFVVGPYVRQEKRTDRDVRVAVWTRREDRSKGEFALDYASRMLQIMENYFSINYLLPKLDLVAAPNYPVGAMENWGLLIFHQRALLYSEEYRLIDVNSPNQLYQPHLPPKFYTSKIIIHELLHQWFGNLATMHWWSEIWLNEGFATFFIYHFLKDDFPVLADFHETWKLVDAWHRQSISVLSDHNPGLEHYALVRDFKNDEEIFDAFDEYHLYAKGGAVVRMLWHLLGENSMRSGVIRYLSANAYRSVDRWELWKYLEYSMPGSTLNLNTTNRTGLGQMMESWLTNPAFPEVKITRTGSNTFQIQQNMADSRLHYSYLPADIIQNLTKHWIWSIPLSYIVEENPLQPSPDALHGEPFWVFNKSQLHSDSYLTQKQWLLANPDMQFPYRINYDLDNWSKLIRQLRQRHDRIQMKSRVQLIVDASFFLKETDDSHYFLDLLGYLKKETELLPMIMGLREIHSVMDQYKASSIYPLLIFYARPIVEQATRLRQLSEKDSEWDAVWWMDENFSLNLKLLQCITKHKQCQISREEVQSLLSLPNNGQITDKLIPVCEFLKRNFGQIERDILQYWLDQQDRTRNPRQTPIIAEPAGWRQDIVFMVSCVYDRELIQRLIDIALMRGDLELLANSLSSTFTLNYNDFLATELWSRLGNASIRNSAEGSFELHLRNMLRSVRTLSELELARRSLSALNVDFDDELSFMQARLSWQERRMPHLEEWFMQKLELTYK